MLEIAQRVFLEPIVFIVRDVIRRYLGSYVSDVKAVILNALTVAATCGLLVAIFGPAPIEAWVPVVLFATLFGLSMDYEVFLVSRM